VAFAIPGSLLRLNVVTQRKQRRMNAQLQHGVDPLPRLVLDLLDLVEAFTAHEERCSRRVLKRQNS
jgi:hypothetical protein